LSDVYSTGCEDGPAEAPMTEPDERKPLVH